jgi:hypothetical protein
VLLLLNQNLYKWRTTSIVWCVEFHRQGVFIGVPGAVTDLIKSVIHQVLAGLATWLAGHQAWPPPTLGLGFHSAASWRASPPRKLTGGHKVGPAGQPPTRPTHQWPLHTASSCQVYSRGGTYFGRIPNFLVIP